MKQSSTLWVFIGFLINFSVSWTRYVYYYYNFFYSRKG